MTAEKHLKEYNVYQQVLDSMLNLQGIKKNEVIADIKSYLNKNEWIKLDAPLYVKCQGVNYTMHRVCLQEKLNASDILLRNNSDTATVALQNCTFNDCYQLLCHFEDKHK